MLIEEVTVLEVQDEVGIIQEMLQQAEFLEVSGNQPFLLADPQSFWLVQSGRVEIFAMRVGPDGSVRGSRYHICTILPGQAFFGQDSEIYGEGLGLLAVGMVNTQLAKLPLTLLLDTTEDKIQQNLYLGRLLDEWLTQLSDALTKEFVSTRTELLLEPGKPRVFLPELQKASARKDNIWFRLKRGELLFLGEENLELETSAVFFPLYHDVWIQALGGAVELETFATTQVIGQPGLSTGLDAFYTLFFRVKSTNVNLNNFDEINRLRQKAEHDNQMGREALRQMASLVSPKLTASEPAPDFIVDDEVGGETETNLLLEACRVVGKFQGIEFEAPARRNEKMNPVDEIVRASRVRSRAIRFEANWWRSDDGPMLGFLENGQPVALLPKSSRSYILVNPANQQSVPVTKALANSLQPTAYVFYRPLPNKSLTSWDLIKFGLPTSRIELGVILALTIGGSLLGLVTPLLTGQLFDSIIPSGSSTGLVQISLIMLVVALNTAAFQLTSSIATLRLESKLELTVQAAIWDRLLNLPVPFFRNYSTGDLANRAQGIDSIRQLLNSTLVTTILGSLFSVFSLGLLFSFDASLGLLGLGLVVITVVVNLIFTALQRKRNTQVTFLQGKITGTVLQMLNGIAKLRVAGAELRAFSVWATEFTKLRRLRLEIRNIGNISTVYSNIWPIFTSLTIYATVGFLINKNVSIGAFLTFVTAFSQLLNGVLALTGSFSTFQQISATYKLSKPLLETPLETGEVKTDPGELTGEIEVSHVSFRYSPETPLVLDDVSLKVEAGQFVAVVGPSGSGKSSLLRLLLGFEQPETGSVFFDGKSLTELDLTAVRQQMGTVIQNGKLMSGDINENIVGGSGAFNQNDAWEAVRLAGFEDDVRLMPMGLQTVISEGGSTLSGGQRQRLMIARAIVGKPRILLFDEATSALDNRTQAIVSQSLERLQATRIVIAHRLSTVINADAIYVISAGKVVESGTYNELMQLNGLFYELATRQLQ